MRGGISIPLSKAEEQTGGGKAICKKTYVNEGRKKGTGGKNGKTTREGRKKKRNLQLELKRGRKRGWPFRSPRGGKNSVRSRGKLHRRN